MFGVGGPSSSLLLLLLFSSAKFEGLVVVNRRSGKSCAWICHDAYTFGCNLVAGTGRAATRLSPWKSLDARSVAIIGLFA